MFSLLLKVCPHLPQCMLFRTRKIALAPFTDALYMMMNPDTPVRDVQIETVFDLLDKDQYVVLHVSARMG